MKVGIIGFGRLGGLLTKHLARDFEVLVFDKKDYKKEIEKCGATSVSIEEAAKAHFVLLFVPISQIEPVCKVINPHLKEDSVVIDACSVKEYPLEMMSKSLPKKVQILGTHPMFGPDSVKDTLFGTKVVLCKERITDVLYENIKEYMERYGIRVIETTATNHDKEIANSLNLTHFVGRSLVEFGAKDLTIDTKGYRRLMKILEVVVNDTWELFSDMNQYNKYAKSTIQEFQDAMAKISKRLEDEQKGS